ncbi:MAG: hypothetical protein AAF266_07595 [Planctomycetota bacterium]
MRSLTLALLGIAALAVVANDATAAGRVSRFANFERLSNPFGVLSASRLSADRFGFPLVLQPEVDEAVEVTLPIVAEVESSEPATAEVAPDEPASEQTAPIVDLGSFNTTIMSSTMTRPPFRPRVRSPFRPPPRPILP